MAKVLRDERISNEVGVGVEYHIPGMGQRIDIIISGRDELDRAKVVIVELKQWSEATMLPQDGMVMTRFQHGAVPHVHPSYQAWSYAALLSGFNEAVYKKDVQLQPCAYLHNYASDDVMTNRFYAPYLERAPVFLKGDDELAKLRSFVAHHVRTGDAGKAIYDIENGRIRPSKMLVDSLAGMMRGNPEFVLIDDQKVVFETVLAAARGASHMSKQVLIVEGGPGTGKSVLAINVLSALSKLGLNCRYVSKNAAPRTVYQRKLAGALRAVEIRNFFSGSGAFMDTDENLFDVLVVDEAHRLNVKSGLYENQGDHQIKEIIRSSRTSVFFVDDNQQVTLKDIGSRAEIEEWSQRAGATTTRLHLASQFRCNGSDGYVAWLDNVLAVRSTANFTFDRASYDFQIFDSPTQLHESIIEKNRASNKARMVAGYCWKWASKRDPQAFDIVLEEFDYKRRWNLASDGSGWIMAENSVEQVGCIHTSQGLEVDYVGVIIGPDFVVRDGEVQTRPMERASSDRSLRGYRSLLRAGDPHIEARADQIIKNTYRTLMTRGMRGCYVYCTDDETRAHFRRHLANE